jgi:curved DNA-binding protein CbpA
MATTQRDYYEVLGVARAADEGEIKRAFRRLARELHPDVSTAPDAQERFREVVEAYEVLSKRETRELYDRFGHSGLRGGGFTPTQFDFGSLNDLFAAFFGDDLFGVGGRPARSRGADLGCPGRDRVGRRCERDQAGRSIPGRGDLRHVLRQRRRAGHESGRLRDLRRRRPATARLSERLRGVRPHADVSGVPGRGATDRAAVSRLPRRGAQGRGAHARGRDPARNP